eukprot:8030878-Karenia_brevis.AAC.1
MCRRIDAVSGSVSSHRSSITSAFPAIDAIIDKTHSREASGPLKWRYPDIETVVWRCDACEKHSNHPSHTNSLEKCRMITPR